GSAWRGGWRCPGGRRRRGGSGRCPLGRRRARAGPLHDRRRARPGWRAREHGAKREHTQRCVRRARPATNPSAGAGGYSLPEGLGGVPPTALLKSREVWEVPPRLPQLVAQLIVQVDAVEVEPANPGALAREVNRALL